MCEFTAKDYKKGQPRWCPGCGDHFFLASLHKAMAEIGVGADASLENEWFAIINVVSDAQVLTEKPIAEYGETESQAIHAMVEHIGDSRIVTYLGGNTVSGMAQSFLEGRPFFGIDFFINGVYTIIGMATDYGLALGLDSTGLLLALLVTQIVAFPCAIVFGHLSAKFDSGKLMKVCIICYTCITLFAMTLMTLWQFWLLAVLVGMFQGAIQALSRSYLGKIIPAEQSGEYFGLMDICGKGAAFLGTTLVSVMSQLTIGVTVDLFGLQLQNENLAVGTLVILFIIGYVLFNKADKMNRK